MYDGYELMFYDDEHYHHYVLQLHFQLKLHPNSKENL